VHLAWPALCDPRVSYLDAVPENTEVIVGYTYFRFCLTCNGLGIAPASAATDSPINQSFMVCIVLGVRGRGDNGDVFFTTRCLM